MTVAKRNILIDLTLLVIASGAMTLVKVWYIGRSAWFGVDDANIYFTYVRNLIDGHGIVFYAGGQPVEGFSSVSWLALLTLLTGITQLPIEAVSLGLSSACSVATLLLVLNWIREEANTSTAWLGVLLLLLTPGFVEWMILSRMETPLWMLLLVVVSYNVYKRQSAVFTLFLTSIILLTRPEGIVIAGIVCATIASSSVTSAINGNVTSAINGKTRLKLLNQTRKLIVQTVILFSLPIAVYLVVLLVRLNLFGVPFPATYYAKVSSNLFDNVSNGFLYLLALPWQTSFTTALFVGLFILVFARKFLNMFAALTSHDSTKNVVDIRRYMLGVMPTALLLLPLTTGGDHFPYMRFVQPALPLVLVYLIVNSEGYLGRLTVPKKVVAFSLIIGSIFTLPFGAVGDTWNTIAPNRLRSEFMIARDGREEARLIQTVHASGHLPRWGVTSAGGTSFGYHGVCLDLLGLNNLEMAMAEGRKFKGLQNHASFNADVFFRQRVDILCVFGSASETKAIARFKEDWRSGSGVQRALLQGVIDNKKFSVGYVFCRLGAGNNAYYCLASIDWLDSLPLSIARQTLVPLPHNFNSP